MWIACIVMGIAALFSVRAAYRNGVRDGFGYAKEPWNPGYTKAGKILKSD